MSWFTKIFTGGVAEVATSVTSGLDSLFTSDEERGILQNKRAEIEAMLKTKLMEIENGIETFIQKQVSKRHSADMQSDSWLSKNIRPLSLLHVTAIIDVIIILAYFGHTLEATMVALVGGAWELMNMFYFGGRSIEKAVKMISSKFKKGE